MEVQKKLTRTNSSLLRSSPTIRSSIHSISSISEEEEEAAASEEEKPHKSGSRVIRSNRVYLPIFCVLLTPLFFFFYLRRQDIPNSLNLILPLGFISILIFIAKKKRVLFVLVKNLSQLCFERNSRRRKASVEGGTGRSESVQWYIGNEKERCFEEKKVIIREGVQFYSNGDFYEGEFHKGKSNGSGVYTYFVNGRYEGDWIDGRYDGYGIESWAKGSRYRGQYRQGLRHGYGVYRFYTGDSYAGEWFNGQSHGIGVQTCSDGSCFVGEFKCGIKHGLGCYHFRNGDKYAGEYFGDKIHGFGVYHFANGHCYEGSWHEGRKQGFGIYTFRSGETKCGEWDVGILRSSVPQLTDSILRAVQAARKAAERAIHLKRVDDQVNRAVMAANRAATAARVAAIKAVQNRMDGKFCDTNL